VTASWQRFIQLPLLVWLLLAGVALAQAGGGPRLRVMHAAPGAPNADVYIDGNLTFPNLNYRAITNYIGLGAGNHTLRVVPAGQNNPVILELTLPFVDGKDYTFLAVGKLDNIQAWQIEDDNTIPPGDKVRVRLVHAAPDAPGVDVCVAGQNTCPITNLNFKNASGYATLDPGVYNLDIRRAGTGEVLLNIPEVRLDGGLVYSLFLTGLLQGDPRLQLVPRIDTGQAPPEPPDTGAFLAPEVVLALFGIVAVLAGGTWFVRRWWARV
jgi:hypothetical protein